jgi:hypothetical protein
MVDDEDEAVGRMIVGRGNGGAWRIPAPVPLCKQKYRII